MAQFLAREADATEESFRSAEMLALSEASSLNTTYGNWWADIAASEAERADDPLLTARSLITMGTLRANEFRWDEARDAVEKGLALLESLDGRSPIVTSVGMKVLARAYFQTGDVERALEIFDQALAFTREKLGDAHPTIVRLLKQQAFVVLKSRTGEGERALELAREAVARAESIYSADSPAVLDVVTLEANILLALERPEEGLPIIERTLNLVAGEGGPPEIEAELLMIEADYWHRRGNWARSEPLFRRTAETRERLKGREHPLSIDAQLKWSSALHALGRTEEARAVGEAGLVALGSLPNRDHPSLAFVHSEAAYIAKVLGQSERALELSSRALALSTRAHRPGHPLTIELGMNVCNMLGDQQRHEEAVRVCQRTATAARASDEFNAVQKGNFDLNLGAALFRAGRIDEARAPYERALEAFAEALGPDTFPVSVVVANIAEVDLQSGSFEAAAQGYARALEIRERTRGASTPALGVPLLGLAEARLEQGRYGPAMEHVERAHALAVGSDGAASVAAARATMMRARVLARSAPGKNAARADRLAREALAIFEAAGVSATPDADAARTWLEARGAR